MVPQPAFRLWYRGVDIASEYYLSMVVDRASGRVALIVSTEGGMNIEDVAHDKSAFGRAGGF